MSVITNSCLEGERPREPGAINVITTILEGERPREPQVIKGVLPSNDWQPQK